MAAESIDAVRQIWGAGPEGVDLEGRFFRISGRAKRPQVIQRPGPLLAGTGSSGPARQLAATHLDAWITTADDSSEWTSARSRFESTSEDVGEGRESTRIIHHIHVRETARGDLRLISNGAPLEDHAESLADSAVDGLLIELQQWSASAVDGLAQLVVRLERSGQLIAGAERRTTW